MRCDLSLARALAVGAATLTGATAALAGTGPLAQGQNRWLLASFPVEVFAGYTSGYGSRVHPIAGDRRHHDGIDIAAPLGSVVRNWWTGQLVEVINDSGCGIGLVIRSGPYEHLYCHLAGQAWGSTYRSGSLQLQVGQWLRSGQPIAHVGVSGASTGPHLHWGLRHRGRSLNPALVLRAMATSRRLSLIQARPPRVGLRP